MIGMLRNHLVYDDSCSLCRAWKNLLVGVDAGRHLKPISIQNAGKLGLLKGIPPSEHYKSFHLVTHDGSVISAGKAIPVLLRLLLDANSLGNLLARSKYLMFAIERTYNFLAYVTHISNCGRACPPKVDPLR